MSIPRSLPTVCYQLNCSHAELHLLIFALLEADADTLHALEDRESARRAYRIMQQNRKLVHTLQEKLAALHNEAAEADECHAPT